MSLFKATPLLIATVSNTARLLQLTSMKQRSFTVLSRRLAAGTIVPTTSPNAQTISENNKVSSGCKGAPSKTTAVPDNSDDAPYRPGWRMTNKQFWNYRDAMAFTSNPCGCKVDIFTEADWRWLRGESDVNPFKGFPYSSDSTEHDKPLFKWRDWLWGKQSGQ